MRSPGNRVRDGHKGVLVTQGLEVVTEHTYSGNPVTLEQFLSEDSNRALVSNRKL